jgi:hypothetical protein
VRAGARGAGPTGRLAGSPPSLFLTAAADGNSLAVAGDDDTLRVWEVLTGQERLRLANRAIHLAFSPDGRALAATDKSTAVLVWDATGRLRDGRTPAVHLGPKEMQALWSELGGADSARAYQAIWTLAAAPRQAVPLLKERLHAVPPPEPARLRRLLADLDHDQFAVRERATHELEEIGRAVRPLLLEALQDPDSLERRRRAQHLLAVLEGPLPSERLRVLRAIEVLEHVASPEARAVLQGLAQGAASATETEHAQAALQRLGQPKSN